MPTGYHDRRNECGRKIFLLPHTARARGEKEGKLYLCWSRPLNTGFGAALFRSGYVAVPRNLCIAVFLKRYTGH